MSMYDDFTAMLILYGLCGLVAAVLLFALMHIRVEMVSKVSKEANQSPYCYEYCDITKRVVCLLDGRTVVGRVSFAEAKMLGIITDGGEFISSDRLLPKNVAYIEAANTGREATL